MALPIPGKKYIIQDENSLSQVAKRAYGDALLWPHIWRANQFELKSNNPDLIYPGEVILIPVIPGNELLKNVNITGKDPDDFTLVIDGLEIKVQSGKLIRTMDTASDGATARIAWNPGENLELDKRILPFGYNNSQVYLGNKLMLTGMLFVVEPEMTASGIVKNLEFYSYTANAIDSSLKPPYEKNNFDLLQLSKELIEPFGLSVIVDDGIDFGGKFDRATASESDKVIPFLSKLAFQRKLLLSSTVEGNLLFTKAKTGKPAGNFTEEQQLPVGWKAKFDGRKRFNTYKGNTQTPKKSDITFVAKDNNVPASRFMTFKVGEVSQGELKGVAEWKRSKALADALSMPLPVSGWYYNGVLFEENTIYTTQSKTLDLPQGVDLLVKSVEFNFSDKVSATLNLVPPEVYTGEILVDPWKVG